MRIIGRTVTMTIGQRFRFLLSPRKRLLNQFAVTAGQAEALAASLRQHSAMCSSPTLKAGLVKLAATATAEATAMRELLLDNGTWPKLPNKPVHCGSSNWERLHSDLALQIVVLRALHMQYPEWVSIDRQIAERMRQFAVDQERNISVLRDVTLKCDPQALD
jgi:hypothetical protein